MQAPAPSSFAALACAAFVLALVLAPSAAAQPPGRNTVWTVHVTVDAEVIDSYARVKVIADIGNRGPDPEFPFQVEVPDNAMVTGLTLVRDGQSYEATIKGRQEARAEYEAQRDAELTAGLVEKQRGSTVFSYLINVAAFESVRAELRYEQYLTMDNATFTLPLAAPVSGFGQDLGASFRVHVAHRDGVPAAWSVPAGAVQGSPQGSGGQPGQGGWTLTHDVGARPNDAPTRFTAHYTTGTTPGAGSLQAIRTPNGGFFTHRFQAAPDDRKLPLDLVMVLDVSGSMAGLKIDQLRDAATQVILGLKPEDRLHLVFFSTANQVPWEGLRPVDAALKTQATQAVKELVAAGGTGIEAALKAAVPLVNGSSERMPVVMFLTDGLPTVGSTDPGVLRGVARQIGGQGGRVFGLAFGSDADAGLVAGLAQDGGGLGLQVAEGAGAEVDLTRFMAAVTTPLLRDVKVTYEGGVEGFTTTVPVLYAGSELMWVGTVPAGVDQVRGTVTGRAADGLRTYTFSQAVVPAPANHTVERIVAFALIERAQTALAAQHSAELVAEVTGLALKYGFVTDHTSLVVSPDAPVRPATTTTPAGTTTLPAATDAGGANNVAWPAPDILGEGSSASAPPGVLNGVAGQTSEAEGSPVPWWTALLALTAALFVARRRLR